MSPSEGWRASAACSDCKVLEPDDLSVKLDLGKMLKLDSEKLTIPSGLLRQPIVGKEVSAPLVMREVFDPQCRDAG